MLCESGRRGQKNGRGYYTYDPDDPRGDPRPRGRADDPGLRRSSRGIEQREVTDQEVLERLLYPMVNEGAKILDEGIAIRGSDIDVVWVNGYGWPAVPRRPDVLGRLDRPRRRSSNGSRSTPTASAADHWELSPLLAELAAEGGALHRHGA